MERDRESEATWLKPKVHCNIKWINSGNWDKVRGYPLMVYKIANVFCIKTSLCSSRYTLLLYRDFAYAKYTQTLSAAQ